MTQPGSSSVGKASLHMLIAMACFVTNDTFVKLLAGTVPVGEIVAVRGGMATLLIGAVCWWTGHLSQIASIGRPPVLLRAALDLIGTLCFVFALMGMPIANLTAILQAVPLTVTLFGALLLGEQVGWRRGLAILVGFAGVVMIVKPDPQSFTTGEALGLACVVSVTLRDLVTRRIPVAVPSMVIAFANAVFVTAGGLVLALWQGYVPLAPWQVGYLAASALFLAVGYMFMVSTLRLADLSATAPARYSVVVFSIVSGVLVFAELPDHWMLLGIGLIVASGFYTLKREARLRQLARLKQAAATA